MAEQPQAIDITRPGNPDISPAPSLEQIKSQLAQRHARIEANLIAARQQRDRLNADIRILVADEAEARRVLSALEPRKTKKAAK